MRLSNDGERVINYALLTKLQSLSEEQISSLYQQVFNSDAGKLVLEDLRHRGYCFVPTTSDRDEGKREMILHIETMINPAPKPIETPTDETGEQPAYGE